MDNIKNQKNKTYFFIAAMLAIFVPAPGRFAYAIVLLLLFNIQIATLTFFYHISSLLKIEKFRNVLMVLELIFVTILFKQLLILFCPIMAFTLGFCIYLPALSTVAIQFLFEKRNKNLSAHFLEGISKSLVFSGYSLLFFLLREILGFATISFPGFKHIIIVHLPIDIMTVSAGAFFSTIPGSLSMIAILLAIYIFVSKKFEIIKNMKKGDE